MIRQREAVRAALAETVPELPVDACLCFLNPSGQLGGSDMPVLRTLELKGVPLLYPRNLARRLNARGALSAASLDEVARLLAARFPSAT